MNEKNHICTQVKQFATHEIFSQVLLPTVVVHFAILLYMAGSHFFTVTGQETGLPLLRAAVVNWDAQHYLRLAREGYGSETFLITFYPLYPFLISVVQLLLRNDLASALFVSFVSHLLGAYYFYKLVCLDWSKEIAQRALWAFLLFPSAFTAVIPYSESLFFCLVVSSFYFFRTRQFLKAGLLALLCPLTRLPGIVMIPTFVVEFFALRKEAKVSWNNLFGVVFLGILGFGIWLMINYAYYQDFFYFMKVQKTNFFREFASPHTGFLTALQSFYRPRPENVTMGFTEALGAVLSWIISIYAFFRLRKSYATYCAASSILFSFTKFWFGNLRYCLMLFPLYILLSKLSHKDLVRWLLAAFSLGLLALLSLNFARGYWTF